MPSIKAPDALFLDHMKRAAKSGTQAGKTISTTETKKALEKLAGLGPAEKAVVVEAFLNSKDANKLSRAAKDQLLGFVSRGHPPALPMRPPPYMKFLEAVGHAIEHGKVKGQITKAEIQKALKHIESLPLGAQKAIARQLLDGPQAKHLSRGAKAVVQEMADMRIATTRALGEEGGATTAALGEEGGGITTMAGAFEEGGATTAALGEEGGGAVTLAIPEGGATTAAVGEEGGASTEAVGEEGGATTMAMGEEGGASTEAVGEEGGATTMAMGEEGGSTTMAMGEEGGGGITTMAGAFEEGGATTAALGEEGGGAVTLAIPEGGATTAAIGEEGGGITTEAVGEE